MRASSIEFRLRMAINATIIILGFWAPWIEAWGFGRRITLLEWLALQLSRTGLVSFTVAAPMVIAAGALIAAVAAGLRVWGTAYLGTGTVNSLEMKAGRVVADGPFRYVRNPLYLGVWFMVAAMCFIMPATGALFAIVFISLFLMRLILAEEAFLSAKTGEPYTLYLRAVPRLVPRLRDEPAGCGGQGALAARRSGGAHTHWRVCHAGVPVVELRQPADGKSHPDLLRRVAGGAGVAAARQGSGFRGRRSVIRPPRLGFLALMPRCVHPKPLEYFRP